MAEKPTLVKPLEEVVPIAKPGAFDLREIQIQARGRDGKRRNPPQTGRHTTQFRRRKTSCGWTKTLTGRQSFVLPVYRSEDKERLVAPTDEDLATQYLPSGKIKALPLGARNKATGNK